MRITRRRLAAAVLASPAALAQTSTTAPLPANAEEELKAAREQTRRNGETLAKFQVPIATEPAFQFKA